MKTKVKICGVRTIETAQCAVQSGAEFIGLNFVPDSKRKVDLETAREIVQIVKGSGIKVVGIFRNQSIDEVNRIAEDLALDYVQLHGSETPEYTQKIKAKVIKAFALPQEFLPEDTLKEMKKYKVSYFLLDRKEQGRGELLPFAKIKKIAEHHSIFLAGGLNPENVQGIIEQVHPFAVDVAGGVETNGEQDLGKIKNFITHAGGA